MLSLDFADTAIIEIIATARIMAAIVPNSGTTIPSLISTFSEAVDYLVRVLYGEGNIAESEFSYTPKSEVVETTTNLSRCWKSWDI